MAAAQREPIPPGSCVAGLYTIEVRRVSGGGKVQYACAARPTPTRRPPCNVVPLDDYRPKPPERRAGLLRRALSWLTAHLS